MLMLMSFGGSLLFFVQGFFLRRVGGLVRPDFRVYYRGLSKKKRVPFKGVL